MYLLGILYSFLCLMCSLGMGSMVQANSAVSAVSFTWKLPLWLAGLIFAILTAAVIRGGIGRIGHVAERMVPAAAGIYIIFSLL